MRPGPSGRLVLPKVVSAEALAKAANAEDSFL
ncbi:hypothetical protein Thi970DRAFT_00458 [Thiorhodovibrio frisius]|uniref:Uncharacterized protein n=1 Tax=Thiorhodovibrio frisius TaxID=631362 RepID=H8YWJ7_9GAMM|nr:hypothetical protein Thi970DRAFT_00458 [Thiorhodovibrio frisius]WPL22920.1 hypothetical protein Thiofri_03098 [Thiorhodovibrio frisius]